MSDKKLLVLERSSCVLEANGVGEDKYVLEGVFSEIGKKNKNNRIYDEKELIPHINQLQEKVKTGKLLGELDHPKQFDISLKNVSHVIEEISYDKANKVVRGKIRLLDTDAGKQAKALVDGGIPIHISSRAAGVVENNGHVKIKKLFTYDLVADPGFENAELNRVNEQFGFENSADIQIYELEGYIEKNNTEIQKELDTMENTTENTPEVSEATEVKEAAPVNEGQGNFVSVEDFNEYSKIVKESIDKLTGEITKINESSTNKDIINYSEAIAKRVNQIGGYVENLAENVDNLISHNDYIIENLTKVKDYAEYVGLKTDQNIEYSKHISESVNKRFEYQDYVNEQTDKVIDYSNYVMEGVDAVANYAEYIKENVENLGKYQDYVSKTINENLASKAKESETVNESTEVVEETITETDTFKNDLSSKISALVESAQKQKVEETSTNTHFLNFLNESQRDEFKGFDDETKAKVIRTFENNNWFGSSDASRLWEGVFVEPVKTIDWLENMPAKYKGSWESLDESQKTAIKAQASARNLDTQYKVDHFWSTRDLRGSNPSEQINESANIKEGKESSDYETPTAYMETVTEGLKKRFNK